MSLKEKITSFEQFMQLNPKLGTERLKDHYSTLNETFIYLPFRIVHAVDRASAEAGTLVEWSTDRLPKAMWWAVREAMRIHTKVYPEPTAVTEWLNGPMWGNSALGMPVNHFVHVSTDDPALIAFTMDPEQGAADRQVRMALGRYLRKYLSFLTDAQIQRLEAAHRADLNGEFELCPPDKIAQMYMEAGTSGVGSCMTHKSTNWEGIDKGQHPTMAFNAPGFGLAVLRNSEGRLSARCLVWINPDDPNDKRMVRLYGDQMLERRLARAGFQYKALYGAKLKEIKVRTGSVDNRVLLPYVDGLRGSQGDGTTNIVRRPDGLHFVDSVARDRLVTMASRAGLRGNLYTQAKSTAGYHDLTLIPADVAVFVSAISGKTFDTEKGAEAVDYLATADGPVAKIDNSEIGGMRWAWTTVGGRSVDVVVPDDMPTFLNGSGTLWVDNNGNRARGGFVQLSAKYYPDLAAAWRAKEGTAEVRGPTADGWSDETYRVITDDCVRLLYREDDRTAHRLLHKSEVQPTWKRVADHASVHTYAAPGVEVVTTDTGRKVVEGIHDVVRLYNGVVTYTRNAVQVTMMGTHIYMLRKEAEATHNTPVLPADHAIFLRLVAGRTLGQLEASERDMWGTYVGSRMHLHPTGTLLAAGTNYSNPEPLREALMALGADCTAAAVLDRWPSTSPQIAQMAANYTRNFHVLRQLVDAARTALAATPAPASPPAAAPAPADPSPAWQVGMTVRVLRKPSADEPRWGDSWVSSMDSWLGDTAVVYSVYPHSPRKVGLRNARGDTFNFPAHCLAEVAEPVTA